MVKGKEVKMPDPHCKICYGTGTWEEGICRCVVTAAPKPAPTCKSKKGVNMEITQEKLMKLLALWEHVPVGLEEDQVQVVLAHEATGKCAAMLREAVGLPQLESSGDIHMDVD